jgi:hypothetical protein
VILAESGRQDCERSDVDSGMGLQDDSSIVAESHDPLHVTGVEVIDGIRPAEYEDCMIHSNGE